MHYVYLMKSIGYLVAYFPTPPHTEIIGMRYFEANCENVRKFEYVEEVARRQKRRPDFQPNQSQHSLAQPHRIQGGIVKPGTLSSPSTRSRGTDELSALRLS